MNSDYRGNEGALDRANHGFDGLLGDVGARQGLAVSNDAASQLDCHDNGIGIAALRRCVCNPPAQWDGKRKDGDAMDDGRAHWRIVDWRLSNVDLLVGSAQGKAQRASRSQPRTERPLKELKIS